MNSVSQFSVLLKSLNPVLPFNALNIDRLEINYNLLTRKSAQRDRKKVISITKKWDEHQIIPFDVNTLLHGQSGLLFGYWQTQPKTTQYNRWRYGNQNSFVAQVTPFQVHAKIGFRNGQVWVTDALTGKAVTNAKISLLKANLNQLLAQAKLVYKTKTNQYGIAMLPKREGIDPTHRLIGNYSYDSSMLFVRVEHQNDIAYLPLNYHFMLGYTYYGYYGRYGGRHRHAGNRPYSYVQAWGFSAQGVYKLGDKVQFKIIVRDQGNFGLIPPPLKSYALVVKDPLGKTVYTKQDIKLSQYGSFADTFQTNKTNAAGYYQFSLTPSFDKRTRFPLRVLITDFKPAPFRVTNKLDKSLYHLGDALKVTTRARLHAGGPYASAKTRITTQLKSTPFVIDTPLARGFFFQIRHQYQHQINQGLQTLNQTGTARYETKLHATNTQYGEITVESAVADDRGKFNATQSTANYAGLGYYVGMQHKQWLLKQNKPSTILLLVADPDKKIVENIPVDVVIQYQKHVLKKSKGANASTALHTTYKWINESECKVTSDQKPVPCQFSPKNTGYYRITAKVKDQQGHVHTTTLNRWSIGKQAVVWRQQSKHTLKLIAEKTLYKVGDRAQVVIQNPYPKAVALVSIERLGIIESWTQPINQSIAALSFKIKENYLPGFYLSVTLVSASGDQSKQDAKQNTLVKYGSLRFTVSGNQKRLFAKIATDKNEYKPRDKVTATIQIQDYLKKPTQAELAVAVVDESVFDLIQKGKLYYDPYSGHYQLRGLDVQNYNLLKQLLTQKTLVEAQRQLQLRKNKSYYSMYRGAAEAKLGYARKSAPMAFTKRLAADQALASDKENAKSEKREFKVRKLFKFLSYWNGQLKTNSKGFANIHFQAPDNLTGWKVIVIATDRAEKMGMGETRFQVNQPIELRAALPNQVTSDDTFEARFTVLNRSKTKREIEVQLTAQGAMLNPQGQSKLNKVIHLTAEPFKRKIVTLPITSKGHGKIEFQVIAKSNTDSDALQQELVVLRQKSTHVGTTYGTSIKTLLTETLKIPKDIRDDVGAIKLIVSPTVISNLSGAFRYLKNYPYMCWEQKLTKGVMASHYQNLKSYLPKSLDWAQSKGLSAKTIALARAYQAPNGGMTYFKPQNRYVSPYLSAYTALAFNWLRDRGHVIPQDVESKLHNYLKQLLLKKDFPNQYNAKMQSTIHAVILAALAQHQQIGLAQIKQYAKYINDMSLFGKAHYLTALTYIKGTRSLQKKVAELIVIC